jgi:type IV pilus assembly protein PilM
MCAAGPPMRDDVADKVIGLDVGTSGVRAVSMTLGDRPRLHSLAHLPLPPGAVQEGEVVDPSVVAGVLRSLWKLGGFKGRSVRLAIASPRVIVRPVDMPRMPEADTRAALRFQLGDYIPMAPEATLFDFQELQGGAAEPGRERQVLLAAAPRDAVEPLVDAVRHAGLRVAHIDVAAASLARVLGDPGPGDSPAPSGTEAIVSIGAGTIVVVVARDGEVVFARTVSNGAAGHITERIAMELAVPPAEAERLTRRLPSGTPADIADRVLVITDPFVTELTEEIGDSLDYFAAQPGGRPVDAITITGGAALVVGLEERLERRLGVSVRFADPFRRLTLGAAGVDSVEAARLAPFMAVAVGTAVGAERARVRPIDLMPDSAGVGLRSRRPLLVGAAAAAVLLGGVYLYVSQGRDLDAAKSARAQVEQDLAAARERAATGGNASKQATAIRTSLGAVLQQARAGDVDWAAVAEQLDAVSEPLGVGITSVAGSVRPATPATPSGATPPGSTTVATTAVATTAVAAAAAATSAPPNAGAATGVGSLNITGQAPDLYVVAAWLDAVAADGHFETAWVDSTTADPATGSLQFTATVALNRDDLVARPAIQAIVP